MLEVLLVPGRAGKGLEGAVISLRGGRIRIQHSPPALLTAKTPECTHGPLCVWWTPFMDRLDYFIETCEITAFRLSRHLHPTVILGVGAGSGTAPFSQSFFATREEPWGITAAHGEWG